ncbi:MAG: serine hydrolase [Rivularia sp. (in: Bacteria)]|nr:serine hydrolase [Rivularia sp. MS3]
MRISDKKRSVKLFSLQFCSIVIGVALITTSIGLIILKQNYSYTEKVTRTIDPDSTTTPSFPIASALPVQLSQISKETQSSELAYNIINSPNFTKSDKLQKIVNEAIDSIQDKKFPTKPLSITLIDVKTSEYAGYQQKKLRYPASVAKLFWMVYLYAQIETGILSEAEFPRYLDSMIKKSDNEAASYIVDRMSQTKYRKSIKQEDYKSWRTKRLQVNEYFQDAGYEKINVSQKTFPIPNLKLSKPQGSDLKLRENLQNPIRNQVSTKQVARLLYEIYDNQSVSATSSQKMTQWLTIDSHTRSIKKDDKNPNEFNPVRGFLSASLPNEVRFMGKAGWTSGSRNDAAIITTPDGKTAYILVIFGEDKAYAYDWQIFPQISKLIFNRMTNKK